MTKIEPADVSCPKCHTKQSVMLYDSLNVTIDPEAKKDLLDRKINVFKCNICNIEITVQKTLLYHDMMQHFSIYFIPEGAVFDDYFIKNQISSEGQMNLEVPDYAKDFTGLEYLMNPHIVLDMDELIRYVIFRDRVADIHPNRDKSESS
jgi:inosine-uridine nucleoside N-ribohydrolase